jgi:hypothetical protein
MRKPGFRIVLSLILAVALLIIPFANVSAAPKNPRSYITITHLAEDEISFDWGWDKVNADAYSIYVVETTSVYYFEHHDFEVKTRSLSGNVTVTATGIDVGDQNIYVRLWLYDKNGKLMKPTRIDMRVVWPAT